MGLPNVELLALGGTIASLPAQGRAGVSPRVCVEDLVAAVPDVAKVARVRAHQVLQVPSAEVTPEDVAALAARAAVAVDEGAVGVVVTQGTDTLEETAFLLDLWWDRPEPVVVTGAMRTPDVAGADGPANLLAAVRVAAAAQARDAGVVTVMGDRIHAARYVRKAHTSDPAAFSSPGYGPVGLVTEGRVSLGLRPVRPAALSLPGHGPLPRVALVRVTMGDDGRLLEAAAELGVEGVVLEGLGGGHVPSRLLSALDKLVARAPVLLASRTGAGEVLSDTYGYAGGDVDLVRRGLLPVGDLDGAKARLLLMAALAITSGRAEAEAVVRRVART